MNSFKFSGCTSIVCFFLQLTHSRQKRRIDHLLWSAALIFTMSLTACGGGGGGGSESGGSTSFTVSNSAGANGSIDPGSRDVNQDSTTSFTVTPDANFQIDTVSGCGGSLTGNTYTTGAITANCTVTASFVAEITNNISAKALDIITVDPRIGYPLKVSVSIDADENTNDVDLAFFAIDKDRVIVRQIALGTGVINQVVAGTDSYELDLDIPSIVETPGPYFIGVLVDAANTIAETNEADNEASTVMTLSVDPVPNLFIDNMEADRSAIELDENGIFAEQIQLGVVNSDAGGTLTWGVKGTEVPIEVETFAVLRLTTTAASGETPFSHFRGAITIAPTPSGADTSNSHDVPLYLWNSDELRYMNAYGVDTTITCVPTFVDPCAPTLPIEWLPVGPVGEMLVPGVNGGENVQVTEFDRRSAHLDFYFPGKLAKEIGIATRGDFIPFGPIVPPPDLSPADIQALRSFMPTGLPHEVTAALCVKIRPADSNIVEDSADDNEVCSPVALLLAALPPLPPSPPPPPPTPPQLSTPSNPVLFEQLYQNGWGGTFFGFGIDFSASTSADNRGVIISAQGSLPVQVFGQSVDFMGLDGRLQVLPLSDRDDPPAGQTPGFDLTLSHLGLILVPISLSSGSIGPFEFSVSKDVVGIKKKILVGPVPVDLEAALAGNIGVQYQINLNQDLQAELSQDGLSTILDEDGPSADGLSLITAPFINIEVGASATADLILVGVGVEGVLTLLEEKFNIVAGASINVLDADHKDGTPGLNDGTSEIVIVPRLRIINELTGAQGAINVFATLSIPTIKQCSWGFFPGFCPGFDEVKYPINLVSYTAWKKVDPLLDESVIIDIVTLPDGTVSYFQ